MKTKILLLVCVISLIGCERETNIISMNDAIQHSRSTTKDIVLLTDVFDTSRLSYDQYIKLERLFTDMQLTSNIYKLLIRNLYSLTGHQKTKLEIRENYDLDGRYNGIENLLILNATCLDDAITFQEEMIHRVQYCYTYSKIASWVDLEFEAHLFIDAAKWLERYYSSSSLEVVKYDPFLHTPGLHGSREYNYKVCKLLGFIQMSGGYCNDCGINGVTMKSMFYELCLDWPQRYHYAGTPSKDFTPVLLIDYIQHWPDGSF